MRTQKAKKANSTRSSDMQRFMALLKLYRACLSNAAELLEEAKLLLHNKHTARAFALAYTGWEEVGKSQLVGDFANDMVSKEEFEAAFIDHKLKSAYNQRHFVLNTGNLADSTIEYDISRTKVYWQTRQASLYVEKTLDLKPISPDQCISTKEAEAVIQALEKAIQNITYFDAANERIGSMSFLK